MVLAYTRRTFEEVLRYVETGNLSDECADFLKYKWEGAFNILHMSWSHIYNIPATFIDQAAEIFFMVKETLREIQQNRQSNMVHFNRTYFLVL